ncbi:MAG: hypothetical protein FWG99_08460 [Treponema sp.]|nr:hypothetical protein [Treponema sp.]
MILPVFTALILAGCASTIRIQVPRTPALDTSGIRRIAVMQFRASGGSDYQQTAQYATSTATSNIRALNHFTLVDPSVIVRLQRNNENIEGYVDALFNGQITRIESRESAEQRQRKDRDGNEQTYTLYTREVELEFNYYLTRARDGSLIGPILKSSSASSSGENRNNLQSTTTLLRKIVDEQLRYLSRDIAPYTIVETRKLASEKSKDKELRAIMKDALAQTKEGSYRLALESYLIIYAEYKNIAAAQNASILHEALGDTRAAFNLMQRVFTETGNPKALNDLTRLNRILADQATIASEYGNTRSQAERVAAFASDEIQKILPRNAKVWIFNNAGNNTMTQAVVDNLIANFIYRGIGLVERDNAALIEAEHRFQVSGSVSDDDFLSIGNAYGANTIVVVGITGAGDMRRLQLRVLDIERGVPIMQSDTGDAWKL